MTEAADGTLAANRSAAAAYRMLWLAVAFDLMAFGVGFAWDRRWHATHVAPAVTGALDLYLRARTP